MKIPKLTLITVIVSAFTVSTIMAADKEKSSTKDLNMTPMTDMLKSKSGDEFEAHFLGMMILHHQDGLKMGELALEKASSSELKQMMQKSAKDQREQNEQMTGWLKQWHNKAPNDFKKPAAVEQMMKKNMSELQGLSGAEFDKKFAHHMAEHHVDAIAMGEMAANKAQHAEVKQLAGKIAKSQEPERQKLMRMSK